MVKKRKFTESVDSNAKKVGHVLRESTKEVVSEAMPRIKRHAEQFGHSVKAAVNEAEDYRKSHEKHNLISAEQRKQHENKSTSNSTTQGKEVMKDKSEKRKEERRKEERKEKEGRKK